MSHSRTRTSIFSFLIVFLLSGLVAGAALARDSSRVSKATPLNSWSFATEPSATGDGAVPFSTAHDLHGNFNTANLDNGKHRNAVPNLEAQPAVATTASCNPCYANATTGDDSLAGDSPATAKKTIQAAIDAVQVGGEVRVMPGVYSETAVGRTLTSIGGAYQFGLFFSDAKGGVTLQGVDASDNPITDFNAVQATINTNATNDFGPSGIFVEGDNVTLAGVRIGTNSAGQNKTIEVIGDNFTLKHSNIADPEGSVYINDFRFSNFTSHVKAYRLEGNNFQDGVSVDLASGAGFTGPVSGRVITGNTFTNSHYWPSISFNGTDTGVEWFTKPIGGAVIQANTFNNTYADVSDTAGHIRARGTYDNSQFDWASYWNNNTFNKAVVTLIGAPAALAVRTYAYVSGSYHFNDVRRIGVAIQDGVNAGVDNDTVLVNKGTYPESVTVNKTLSLLGEQHGTDGRNRCDATADESIVNNAGGSFSIAADHVVLDGFIIENTTDLPLGTGVYLSGNNAGYQVRNNVFRNNIFGLYLNSSGASQSLVEHNCFKHNNQPGAAAGNGIYSDQGLAKALVNENDFTGHENCGMIFTGVPPADVVTDLTITKNKLINDSAICLFYGSNVLIEENTVTDSVSHGVYLGGGNNDVTVRNNTLQNTASDYSGVRISDLYAAGPNTNININHNTLSHNTYGVRIADNAVGSGLLVNRNNLSNESTAGIQNEDPNQGLDGQCNWWGAISGPSGSGPGSGAVVSTQVDFDPWLGSDNLDGPCATPSVQMELATQSVDEGAGNATIVVKLSEPAGQIITVHYATSDGTATVGDDYTEANGTLTFNPGEISQTITVPILNDNLDENDETFKVTLSNPTYATLGAATNTTLTIVDDDPLPVIQFSSSAVGVNENAGASLIVVTLNTPSSFDVRVNFSTSDGSALATSDYTPNSGQLIIPAGRLIASFIVPITNDTLVEGNETINLHLDTPTNATLGTANATLTIIDDDTSPLVNFSRASYKVNEAAGSATVTVTLSSAAANAVTVAYATSNGSATEGNDYTAASGTLTFNAGETTQTFTVPITNDGLIEDDETVLLSLNAPNGASLGAPANATLTIIDNDGAPIVEGQSATFLVNENVSNGLATVTVELSKVATQTVTVNYATHDGTATAGSDYGATNGVLTFTPGQTSRTFTVAILDDSLDENDESVLITLNAPTNAALGAVRDLTLLIVDDDPPPSVQFSLGAYTGSEGAGVIPITVTLSAESGITVTVPYTVNSSVAVQSSSATANSGVISFAPGQTQQAISIPIVDDNVNQGNHTISITLGLPNHATLGAQKSTTLTVIENDGVSGAAAVKIYLPLVTTE